MSSEPLVSIITPSYNQAAYLENTIRSVLQQDYQALEYIIVDGASEDGSLEIIRDYADQLTWWISEEDSGQAEAINKGLKRAEGEIVAWLNSDDLLLPGAVAQAVELLADNPECGLVFSDAVSIDENGIPTNYLKFGDWGLLDLVSFRIICQPAVFMRKESLEKCGYLDPSYHFMLDHKLWVRIARIAQIEHAKPEYQISGGTADFQYPGLWAAARHHPQAKNAANPTAFARETMRLLEWMEGQPDLNELIQTNRTKVYAGAYRLNARYLLDGGKPEAALKSYWHAMKADPGYTFKHIHRILYAILCIATGDKLASKILNFRRGKGRFSDQLPGLNNWPATSASKTP